MKTKTKPVIMLLPEFINQGTLKTLCCIKFFRNIWKPGSHKHKTKVAMSLLMWKKIFANISNVVYCAMGLHGHAVPAVMNIW